MSLYSKFIVGVAVVVRDGDKVLTLRRRADRDSNPGAWECIAGKVEAGEQPHETVAREVREESGVVVSIDDRPLAAHTTFRNEVPMVLLTYQARYLSGTVRLSKEHDAFAWLTPAEFAARTPFGQLAALILHGSSARSTSSNDPCPTNPGR